MSWTTPRTWIYGELVTVSMMNQQIRNNENALWVGTTAGDIDYYTGATNKSRLGIGTAGKVLRVKSGATAPEWGAPFSAYGNISTSPNVGSATTWTDIPDTTITLSIPAVAVIFAAASFHWVKYTGSSCYLRWYIDGTAQLETKLEMQSHQFSSSGSAIGYKASVTAGSKVCKLQYYNTNYDCSISNISAFAFAFSM